MMRIVSSVVTYLVRVFITNLEREVGTIKKEEPRHAKKRVEILYWHILRNLIQCNAERPSVAFVKLLNFGG